ncbi:MAG: hypothetical protein KBE65_03410 [Phycisphaerae bacterium]|nr:hypothetical protein [Phycisphaerae bacterium]
MRYSPPDHALSFRRSATDRTNNMSEYEIIDTNAQNLGGCGFCGRKDPDNEGYRRKSEWLKKLYPRPCYRARRRLRGRMGSMTVVARVQ